MITHISRQPRPAAEAAGYDYEASLRRLSMDNLVLSMTAGVGRVSLKDGKDGLQAELSDATESRPYAAERGGPHT